MKYSGTIAKLASRFGRTIMYGGDPALMHGKHRRSRNFFILQAVCTTLVSVVLGGSFLNGFALSLGLPEGLVSMLALLPNIAGLTLVVSPAIFNRMKSQKWFVVYGMGIARLLLCASGLIPFIAPYLQSGTLLILQILGYVAYCYSATVLNAWYMSIVNIEIRGRYTGLRNSICMIVNVLAPTIAGMLMDSMPDKQIGYAALCCVGFVAAIGEFFCFKNIEREPVAATAGKQTGTILKNIKLVFTNKPFISFIGALFVFYIIFYISAGMIQIYYIRYMELSYTFINSLVVISGLVQMVAFKLWGRLCDRNGAAFVLRFAMWFYMFEYMVWVFSGKDNIYLTSIFATIFTSFAAAGFTIGVFNGRYELFPMESKVTYESFFGFCVGAAILSAIGLSTLLREYISSVPALYNSMENGQIKILFWLTLIGLFLYQMTLALKTGWFKKLGKLIKESRA